MSVLPVFSQRTYVRHGLAKGDTLRTFKFCDGLLRQPWYRFDPVWQSAPDFTRGVIAEVGLRPESDDTGKWILVPRPDVSYLLDSNVDPDDSDRITWEEWLAWQANLTPAQWRMFERLPRWVHDGIVFKPGHVAWQWEPAKVRTPKLRRSKPLPDAFHKGDWPRADDKLRSRAAKARRRALQSAE